VVDMGTRVVQAALVNQEPCLLRALGEQCTCSANMARPCLAGVLSTAAICAAAA